MGPRVAQRQPRRERALQRAGGGAQRRAGAVPAPARAGEGRHQGGRRRPGGPVAGGHAAQPRPGPRLGARAQGPGAAGAVQRRCAPGAGRLARSVCVGPRGQAQGHDGVPARRAHHLARRRVAEPAPVHRGCARHGRAPAPAGRPLCRRRGGGGRGAAGGRGHRGPLGRLARRVRARDAPDRVGRRGSRRRGAVGAAGRDDVRGQRDAGRALGAPRRVHRPAALTTSRRGRRAAS